MVNTKKLLLLAGIVLWGFIVFAFVVYLFFPYQRVFKIALQNTLGAGRTTVSMEGVGTRAFGIKASRLRVQPEPFTGQKPFELSNINITWSPLSLLVGTLSVKSTASLYDGTLDAVMDKIRYLGPSNPTMTLTFKNVNMAKVPEGIVPWIKGTTGILNGTITKHPSTNLPDRQVGTFRFFIKGGEIRELQMKGMPRLIIPSKELSAEGKLDGSRIDLKTIDLRSEAILLKGSGVIDTISGLDIRLSYRALSQTLPFKGQGSIQISGSQYAPVVTVSGPDTTDAGGSRAH
jgi:type II secretion system protein N